MMLQWISNIRFKDDTTVDLKWKSTLMAFNTMIPTMEEVQHLPKYQIAFEDLNPQRYYDEVDITKITTPTMQSDKSNTNATLFSTEHDSCVVPPVNETVSLDESISLMLKWDIETSHSVISSLPALEQRDNSSEDDSSIHTAIVFPSRFFPLSNIHQFFITDTSIDDDISILTYIEQEYDFREINKELMNIPKNTMLNHKENAKDIAKIYNVIKHNNTCTLEPSTHQEDVVFFDSHQYEEQDEFHDCLEEQINEKAFHLSTFPLIINL